MTEPLTVGAELARSAGARPDHPAVLDDAGTLALGELDALAATLAAVLRELAPGTGPVPMVVGQDRWAAVAFHALFRAGRTAAPLDPDLPPAAVRELWARLGRPPVVVVAEPGAGRALPDAREIVVPRRPGRDLLPPEAAAPETPAAIVFTSGSTGRPKGVVLPWAALDAARAQDRRHGYDPATARLAVTARTHWVGGIRHMTNLATGVTQAMTATLLVDPEALVAWWDAIGATQVSTVPSLALALTRRGGPRRRVESVRSVAVGGEPLTWEHVRALRSLVAPDAVIRNSYGASETAGVSACEHRIEPPDDGHGPIPVGRATPELQVRTEPVPGATGGLHQLFVGGAIATGYLDDPTLDAAHFVTDGSGARWWRSGDLVRVGDDGVLWAAGRVDDVVKINGVLVAPLQAEEVLWDVDGIRDVAVVPRETARGTRLVGHLVVDPAAGLSPDAVRAHCAQRLAPPQVPHLLVRHDALPTLTTGKVDRASLRTVPAPPWRTGPVRGSRSSLENWCLATAREVTGFDDIAPDDDLFLAGLDSLGVVDLCGAVEEAGLGRLEPDRVLDLRTVAALADELGRDRPVDPSPVHVLNREGTRAPIVMIPPGGGTAIGYRHLADALGCDRPLAVVEARCLHRRARIPRTVARFAADAVTDVSPLLTGGGPVVVAGFSSGGPVAFEAACRLRATGRTVHLVLLDTSPTFARLAPDTALAAIGAAAGLPAATGTPPTTRRGLRRLVPPPLRGLRGRARRRRAEWFARRPRFDVERYRAVLRVMVRAGTRYRPSAATFPVTLVHVAGSGFPERCAEWAPDLDLREVPGRHDTMLGPPHAAAVAAALAEVADAATADG